MKDQIWLIGFMGTGKSRISRPLAAALDWQQLDIDTLVVERAGRSFQELWAEGGEQAFRVIESQAIEEVAGRTNVVVATGGGSVLAESNRQAMSRSGFVVCLEARAETILSRVSTSADHVSDRPLLAGTNPIARITELKAERQPLYAQADFIIQTDELTPDQVTHQVLLAFREQAASTAYPV